MSNLLILSGISLLLAAAGVFHIKEERVATENRKMSEFNSTLNAVVREAAKAGISARPEHRNSVSSIRADHTLTWFLAGSGTLSLIVGLAVHGSTRTPIAGQSVPTADKRAADASGKVRHNCPWCGWRLNGEYPLCMNCKNELTWIEGIVCRPSEAQSLAARIDAERRGKEELELEQRLEFARQLEETNRRKQEERRRRAEFESQQKEKELRTGEFIQQHGPTIAAAWRRRAWIVWAALSAMSFLVAYLVTRMSNNVMISFVAPWAIGSLAFVLASEIAREKYTRKAAMSENRLPPMVATAVRQHRPAPWIQFIGRSHIETLVAVLVCIAVVVLASTFVAPFLFPALLILILSLQWLIHAAKQSPMHGHVSEKNDNKESIEWIVASLSVFAIVIAILVWCLR